MASIRGYVEVTCPEFSAGYHVELYIGKYRFNSEPIPEKKEAMRVARRLARSLDIKLVKSIR